MKKAFAFFLFVLLTLPCAVFAQSGKWSFLSKFYKSAALNETKALTSGVISPRYLPGKMFPVIDYAILDKQIQTYLAREIASAEKTGDFLSNRLTPANARFLNNFYAKETYINAERKRMMFNVMRLKHRQAWIPNRIPQMLAELSKNRHEIDPGFDFTSVIPKESKVIFIGESVHDEQLYRDMFKRIVKQYQEKGEQVIIASEFSLRAKASKSTLKDVELLPSGTGPLLSEELPGLLTYPSYADLLDFAYHHKIPFIPLEDPAFSSSFCDNQKNHEELDRFSRTNEGVSLRNKIFMEHISDALAKYPNARIFVFTGVNHSRKFLSAGTPLYSLAMGQHIASYVIELTGGRFEYANQPAGPLLGSLRGQDSYFLTSFDTPSFSIAIGADMYINVPFSSSALYRNLKSPEAMAAERLVERNLEAVKRFSPTRK